MSTPCQCVKVPKMHVGKNSSIAAVTSFIKRKYHHLTDYLGKSEARYVFYKAVDFIAMLEYFLHTLPADGVRIYIATYSKLNSPNVPQYHDELLTLIFSPTTKIDTTFKDQGAYYIIYPGNSFHRTGSLLDKELAREWIKNYQEGKLRYVLNGTFDDTTKTDTRSIHFEKELLQGLIDELKCQKATGIRAYFSADPNPDSRFYQQLLLQFVLTHLVANEEVDFYIDDQDGFDDRKKPGNLDTGNPCPPATCAGSELP